MMIFDNQILFAFSLTLFAGLSTGIGSALAFFTKRTNTKLLSFALGLSAGVMIYVSFVEIFPQSITHITSHFGLSKKAELITVLSFFIGMGIVFLIDMLVPKNENPHELHKVEDVEKHKSLELKRVGIMTAIAIAIHNFPEGIATFTAAMVSPELGIPIAVAIAIHNIPEGIAVSIPLYHATGNRSKSFWLSFSSGLAEPLGGLFSFLILSKFLSPYLLGIILAAVAGIMVYISVDELLPAAEKYGKHHYAIVGFVVGMAIMAGSLIILGS